MTSKAAVPVMSTSWFSERHLRASPLNVRTLPAAIRIPRQVGGQLIVFPAGAPRLFVHEGARQALERRFLAAHPGPVMLSITDNRHAMITYSVRKSVLQVRLHHMFLSSPARVLDALVRYVVRDDREASVLVGQYIDVNDRLLARRSRRNIELTTQGTHHDLLKIVDDLNRRYFEGGAKPLVTWGTSVKPVSGKRKTIRLGSYNAIDRLIRLHPVLDRAWVPKYFVEFVLYHEMLHYRFPMTARTMGGSGRRAIHPPEFLEQERRFRHFERATAWEKKNLSRLLRA
jgi:hypothetical protein